MAGLHGPCHSPSPMPLAGRRALALDLGQSDSRNLADAAAMAGIDWVHVLFIAATLILSGGAICILLFAM